MRYVKLEGVDGKFVYVRPDMVVSISELGNTAIGDDRILTLLVATVNPNMFLPVRDSRSNRILLGLQD